MLYPLIESVLSEQIAALQSSAATFTRQRAEALAAAESADVQRAGVLARAEQLQAELDALQAELQAELDAEQTPVHDGLQA